MHPRPTRRPIGAPRAIVPLLLLLVPLLISPASQATPSQAELEAAQARLMEIERDFQLVVEEYNATNERLTSIQHDMATTQLVVRRIERQMGSKQRAAVALAIELYKAGPAGAAVEVVLSSDTLADIETRVEYLKSSNEAQAQVFERLAVDRIELDQHLIALEEQKSEALAAEARLADLRSDVQAKIEGQRDEIARLNAAIERAAARQAAAEAAARRAAARTAAAASSGLPQAGPVRPAPAPNRGAQVAVDAALSQVGKPYQWGAAGPDSYDCSGLTSWAWAHAGVSLPHNSGMQYNATPRVARDDWQPGDLLFFGDPIHHVGMYIGNGQMVEAPYTGSHVRVNSAYRSDYVGAGRPGV